MSEQPFPEVLRSIRMRRRLSQLELATRIQSSQRYISFLEQGRSTPGRGIVVRLGEALGLPLRERNDLLHAAGYSPVYRLSQLDEPELAPIMTAINHVLNGHRPYPAIVIDRFGTLIAANDRIDVLTEDAAPELVGPQMNVFRLALHPRGMAPRIDNHTQWAAHILQQLQEESIRNPSDRIAALVAELAGYQSSDATARSDALGFAVPMVLRSRGETMRLITTVTTFATATDVAIAELRLEAFLPVDAATAEALRRRWR